MDGNSLLQRHEHQGTVLSGLKTVHSYRQQVAWRSDSFYLQSIKIQNAEIASVQGEAIIIMENLINLHESLKNGGRTGNIDVSDISHKT